MEKPGPPGLRRGALRPAGDRTQRDPRQTSGEMLDVPDMVGRVSTRYLGASMTDPSLLDRLKPQWTRSAEDVARAGGLLRSFCLTCETQLRLEASDLIARHGPGARLLDATERCRMIGCTGTAIYLAARSYGRPWIALVDDRDLAAAHARIREAAPSS